MPEKTTASNLSRFLLGVELIRTYELNPEMACVNGFIYVGNYQISFDKMSEFERGLMTGWGWMEAEESWGFFV